MERLLGWVNQVTEVALCLCMAGLLVLAFIQVALRYLLGGSLFWAEEVILFAFTWVIFLAATLNFERGAHFGVDVLVNYLPRGARGIVQWVVQLGILAILSVFVWVGFRFALGAWVQESDILRVPKTVVYISLPLAASLMVLVVIRNLIRLCRGQSLKAETEDC
jgi:TRAP-type transport system small permease protein